MFSEVFSKFLKLPNSSISAKVTGCRINRGAGYDLEIPVDYTFSGHVKAIQWAEAKIAKMTAQLEKEKEHCLN